MHHKYVHYVKIDGVNYPFYYSNEPVINRTDILDLRYPDMYVLDIGETKADKTRLAEIYFQLPEDAAFFLIPKEDVQCIGSKPTDYKS